MADEVEKIVQSLDPKDKKALEAIGHELLSLGVTEMRPAGADDLGRSPPSTPLPAQTQSTIER